ncbi:MAG: nucleotidyltransferase domain-containing protein [Candidatus Pacearchaeota archaeon]|jgi:predicted nucleotidyltransferase
MLQIKNNKKKILELFFDCPLEKFYLREISRKTNVAVTSVKKYIEELIKERLIIKINKGIYPSFKAARDNDNGVFKNYKILNMLERLNSSGLIDFIWDDCHPGSIVLYGSAQRGEDIGGSDIDLFVESKEKKMSFKKFEKKLNREIHVFFEKDFSKLNKELKNNIINGIKLKGYLEVF